MPQGKMKMSRIASLAVAFAFVALIGNFSAFGAVLSVTASGQGPTQAEAVATALSEAVKQATGVFVEANQSFGELIVSTEQNYVSKGIERQLRTLQNIGQNNVRIKSGALVKSYVIEQLEHRNGSFSVVVRADIEKYKSNISFADTRPRLLIDSLGGESGYLKNQIYSGVLERVTNSKRFAIVDRRYLDRFQKELALIRSPQGSAADKQKLGQIMGTDFILNIEATGLRCQETEVNIAVTKEVERSRSCRVDVSYQLSELPTSLIVLANKFFRESKVSMRQGGATNSEVDQLTALSEAVSSRVAGDVVESLFPMFIEGFNGNAVIVNAGDKTPQIGDRFQVLKVIQEGQSENTFKFWGARLQPVGEIQVSKIEKGVVIGTIIGDELARDGDFVLKSLSATEAMSTPAVSRERKSVFD